MKNLKELFESEQNKEKKELEKNSKNKNKSNKKNEKIKKTNEKINIYNSKTSNEENNNYNMFEKDLIEKETSRDIFDNNFPINKKMNKEKQIEEMNPTFLTDEKINNAFDFEQDLIKSLKKENKNTKEEIFKDDFDFDFNSDQLNFNCLFFDKNHSQDEEGGEYTGNYEDYRYKSIIDNLNSEYHFSTDEQKSRLDSLNTSNNANNIKNEYEDKKDENENNEFDEVLNYKNKFGYNFINLDNNY